VAYSRGCRLGDFFNGECEQDALLLDGITVFALLDLFGLDRVYGEFSRESMCCLAYSAMPISLCPASIAMPNAVLPSCVVTKKFKKVNKNDSIWKRTEMCCSVFGAFSLSLSLCVSLSSYATYDDGALNRLEPEGNQNHAFEHYKK